MIDCRSVCGNIDIYHSTILAIDPSGAPAIDGGSVRRIRVVASSFVGVTDAPFVSLDAVQATFIDDNWFQPGGAGPVDIAGSLLDIDALDACAFTGCTGSARNTSDDPLSGLDATLPLASPLVAAGVDAIAAGAPTSVVLDLLGDCRFLDGSADIGASEYP